MRFARGWWSKLRSRAPQKQVSPELSISVCVKLGDTVYPDTPLALVGSFDGTQYRVALTLHYITDRIFAKGNAYSYEHAFESVFINPVFATADGNRMLVSQNRYTAVVAPELITKEMTKREMKARTEK